LNSRHLRALPDFRQFSAGHDAAFNEKAVTAMLKHAYNMCHVKDTLRSATGQTYVVDLKKMFELGESGKVQRIFLDGVRHQVRRRFYRHQKTDRRNSGILGLIFPLTIYNPSR